MTTTNANFQFRTKFEKLLNDANRSIITIEFEKFCNLDSDAACNILWGLTYSSDFANGKIEELKLPFESIITLRNELRYQYKKLYPEFLDLSIPEEYQASFEALKKKTDIIVANVILKHCLQTISKEDSFINRLLFLLNNENEKNYFGGIRTLNFNAEESEYLKPFHNQIYDLIKELSNYQIQTNIHVCDEVLSESTDNVEQDCSNDTSVGEQEENETNTFQQEEEDVVLDEMLLNESSEENYYEFKALTPEDILTHKYLFKTFLENSDFNMLLPIGQLGFDLNEVMIKREEIYNLLKAAEAFS